MFQGSAASAELAQLLRGAAVAVAALLTPEAAAQLAAMRHVTGSAPDNHTE